MFSAVGAANRHAKAASAREWLEAPSSRASHASTFAGAFGKELKSFARDILQAKRKMFRYGSGLSKGDPKFV
jgi:hypothetical protein